VSAEENKERRKSFKSEDNKALAQRSREIVSQRNPDLLEEVYAADIVWHEPDQDVQGLEEAKQFYSIYLSAFPDLHVTVEDVMAEGDKVTRWTIRGTHQGEIE
jgi:predicted ester cyclase